MSKNFSCNSGCDCKNNKKKNAVTSSAEEGCNKNSVPNPKSATNNQWC